MYRGSLLVAVHRPKTRTWFNFLRKFGEKKPLYFIVCLVCRKEERISRVDHYRNGGIGPFAVGIEQDRQRSLCRRLCRLRRFRRHFIFQNYFFQKKLKNKIKLFSTFFSNYLFQHFFQISKFSTFFFKFRISHLATYLISSQSTYLSQTSRSVTHPQIAPAQARLNFEFLPN